MYESSKYFSSTYLQKIIEINFHLPFANVQLLFENPVALVKSSSSHVTAFIANKSKYTAGIFTRNFASNLLQITTRIQVLAVR